MKHYPKAVRNYSFWRHPIQWFKDIKTMRLLNNILKYECDNNGLEEKVHNKVKEILVNGQTFL